MRFKKLIEKRKNEKEDDSVEIDDEDLDLEKSVNENTLKEGARFFNHNPYLKKMIFVLLSNYVKTS